MATLLSESERAAALNEIVRSLAAVRQQIRAGGNLARALMAQGQTAADIETFMNATLATLNDGFTNIGSALGSIPLLYAPVVKVGMPAGYTSAAVYAADLANGSYGVIVPIGTGDPYLAIDSGDTVEISSAEDSANNGQYIVRYAPQAAGADVISNGNFTSNLTGWTGTNWSHSSGKALHTAGSTAALTQAYGTMSGVADNKPYILQFDVSGRTAGSVVAKFDTAENSRTATTNGTYQCVVYSDSAGSLTFTPTTDFDGAVDSVSMSPLTWLTLTTALATDNASDTSITITVKER